MDLGIGFMRHHLDNFNTTQEIVDFAMKNKVNYFESCYFYLNGQCESIVEKSLKKYSHENYEICAKMPVVGVLENIKNPDIIFQEQLKNLNVDFFDVYLLQALDIRCLKILEETKVIPYLLKKKKEGYIKKLGFSFHGTPYHLEKILSLKCWDIVQLQLNYFDYFLSCGKELYEIAIKYKIPIYVMGANKGGLLIQQLTEEQKRILGFEWKFFPYKFLASLPGIERILIGAENLDWVQEDICYIKNKLSPLTQDEWHSIEKIIEIYKQNNYIQCTGCNYCQPCPAKINISYFFKEYNNILLQGKQYCNFTEYMEYSRENFPHLTCINCGRCEKMCPQHLKIRELFRNNIFSLRI